MTKKICVYTCITGSYDHVNEYFEFRDAHYDYYLFTNNKEIVSNFWDVIYIENEGLDNIRLARKIKILGHPLLKEYDFTVWVDGATLLRKKVSNFIHDCCELDKYSLIGFKHPERNCIYDEAKACVIFGKESKKNILRQIKFLTEQSYPKHNGLIESCILVRNNKDVDLKNAMNLWFELIKKYSFRDQLSFNYVAYVKKVNFHLLDMKAFDNPYFGRKEHCSNFQHFIEYRVYLGDDSNYDSFNYQFDYRGLYKKDQNKYIISLKTNTSGKKIKIFLDNIGGLVLNNIHVCNKKIKKVDYINSINWNNEHLFFGNFPTVILEVEYQQNEILKIVLDMDTLSESFYLHYIDALYYQLNDKQSKIDEGLITIQKLTAQNTRLVIENEHLNLNVNRLINSRSWKITKPIREMKYFLKKMLGGMKHEK